MSAPSADGATSGADVEVDVDVSASSTRDGPEDAAEGAPTAVEAVNGTSDANGASTPSGEADEGEDRPRAMPTFDKKAKSLRSMGTAADSTRNLVGVVDSPAGTVVEQERRAVGAGDTIDAKDRLPSPEVTAGFCSRLFFSWVGRIFALGNMRPLVMDDLWGMAEKDQAKPVADAVGDAYRRIGTLDGAMKELYRADFLFIGFIRVFNNLAQFAPALVFSLLLTHLEEVVAGVPAADRLAGEYGAYILAACVVLSQTVKTFTENHFFYLAQRLGLRVRTAVTTAVYRKALRLSPAARQGSTTGEVVTLMQNDAQRLENTVTPLHNVWASPMQIVGFMTLLIYFIGPSALVGLVVMMLLIPIQGIVMMKLGSYRKRTVKHTSERVKQANEILQGIRALKFYSWEDSFEKTLGAVRDQEMGLIKSSSNLKAFNSAFISVSPAIVAVASLAVYSGEGGDMSPSVIFAALSVFNQLRFPLMMLPMTANALAEAKVSVDRLNRFLGATEVASLSATYKDSEAAAHEESSSPRSRLPRPTAEEATMDPLDVAAGEMVIDDATFYWANPHERVTRVADALKKVKKAKKSKKPKKGEYEAAAATEPEAASGNGGGAGTSADAVVAVNGDGADGGADGADDRKVVPAIRNMTFKVGAGELVAVVGPVGVGKSALCSAILGELHREEGRVATRGTVAYVAQTAWILNATVKHNILFGSPYDRRRYRRTVRACQLEADLRVLPNGDETEIGERGINLSGGQKQRIALARAMYADTDIYIFDDPLSALDAEVGNAVFTQVITGKLRDKTRLFVTNQLHLLRDCDRIVVLKQEEDGSAAISEIGTLDELLASGLDFAALIESFSGEKARDPAEATTDAADGGAAAADGGLVDDLGSGDEDATSPRARAGSTPSASVSPRAKSRTLSVTGERDGKDLMEAEERRTGAVRFHVWWSYLRVGGLAFAMLTLLLYTITQIAGLYSSLWVAFWADDAAYIEHPVEYWMGGYAILAGVLGLMAYMRAYLLVWLGIKSSVRLHDSLVKRVLRAPMSFFDTTPVGRVLSRFSKDMDAIDTLLPQNLQWMVLMFFLVIGSLAGIVFEAPWFAVAVVPAIFLYSRILRYYRNVSRELKRLDSISRSPVYAHFSETLGGLSTIRAFGQTVRFTKQHYLGVDKNHTAFFINLGASRWLSMRMELLGQLVVLLASMLCAQSTLAGNISAAEAGFAISLAMSLTDLLNWSVRTFVETENQMNSVERVLHSIEQTPQEAPPTTDADAALPADWPSAGEIVFDKVKMRYREGTPLVLKSVSFTVHAGEKVGVVGRTGSGKSSLLLTLYRIVEVESGSVSLDGHDCANLGLTTLRRNLAIIPQDPVLFSGTVRDNLDPFKQYNDADVWEALLKVGLRSSVVAQATSAEAHGAAKSPTEGAAKAKAAAAAAAAAVGAAEGKEGEEQTEEEREALRRAREHAASLAGDELAQFGLSAPVSEFGANFSVGERQLICLARVMLRKTRVLLLDEATSSVDYETDQRIQRILRESFATCTVITIAHRLQTIADSDRIIVMEDGKVAEFAPPHELLSGDGHLTSLVRELGPAAEARLRDIARAAYERRNTGGGGKGEGGEGAGAASSTTLPDTTDTSLTEVAL
mmetsp:Transcript_11549/g.40382  ORF Transcript_11549/g.40382 Transcript_11549/m.40382 type:complete len:1626 (-) Transcript_11549:176-5053(-)